jgi:hypothetical protein
MDIDPGRAHDRDRMEGQAVQAFIIALIILGFFAFVYQGIALSTREATPENPPTVVTVEKH